MTDERVALLNQLDFSWEVRPKLERPRATWAQRLDELQHFHDEYHHFHVPVDAMPHLHAWCLEQKQRLKNLDGPNWADTSKRMGPDRVAALHAMGFTKDVDLGVDEFPLHYFGNHDHHLDHQAHHLDQAHHLHHQMVHHDHDALDVVDLDHHIGGIQQAPSQNHHVAFAPGQQQGGVLPTSHAGMPVDCNIQAHGKSNGNLRAPGMTMI
jgi:hypothetical protein